MNVFKPIFIYLAAAFTAVSLCAKETAPPNIIVFLVDDMGLMDSSVPFLADATGEPIQHPLNQFYRTQ